MPPDLGDRVERWVAHSHGISSHLTVSSSLNAPDEQLARNGKLALAAETLVVERSRRGTRIWGLVPAADTAFSAHVPFQVPSRIPLTPVGPTVELFLSTITVDCRAAGGSGGFGLSSFEEISAYDGEVETASFPTPGWRGSARTFRLASLAPIRSGLDVVYRLGTPVGHAAEFEIRSTSVSLARPRVLPNPGEVATRLGRVFRS